VVTVPAPIIVSPSSVRRAVLLSSAGRLLANRPWKMVLRLCNLALQSSPLMPSTCSEMPGDNQSLYKYQEGSTYHFSARITP
jgi:hypothetical protein